MGTEAGRKLDAEIAEKVMDAAWTLASDVDRHICEMRGCAKPLETLTLGGRTFAWRHSGGAITAGHNMPRYSTDIGAAWLVLEKMREKDFSVDIVISAGPMNAYRVEFWPADTEENYAFGDTAPLAICRAALTAVPSSEKPNQ